MKKTVIALAFLCLSSIAHAESSAAARKQFTDSMATMHQGMTAGLSSDNPDMMFAASMVPHHQGAIDMAKIELEHGTDPAMRALAEEIIRGQGR